MQFAFQLWNIEALAIIAFNYHRSEFERVLLVFIIKNIIISGLDRSVSRHINFIPWKRCVKLYYGRIDWYRGMNAGELFDNRFMGVPKEATSISELVSTLFCY